MVCTPSVEVVVGFWCLVGSWLSVSESVIGCWLSVGDLIVFLFVCWLVFVTGFRLSGVGYQLSVVGCWLSAI